VDMVLKWAWKCPYCNTEFLMTNVEINIHKKKCEKNAINWLIDLERENEAREKRGGYIS